MGTVPVIAGVRQRLSQQPALAQFVKFCVIGASSFAIDVGLLNALHFGAGFPLFPSKAVSFLAGVSNGFFWNSRWTFRELRGNSRAQYPKFVATNVIGLVLNLGIMTGGIVAATRLGWVHTDRSPAEIVGLVVSGAGKKAFNPVTVNGAIIVATVVVTAWNFTAAKFITFRK